MHARSGPLRLCLVALLVLLGTFTQAPGGVAQATADLRLAEAVTDPKTDRDGSGSVTTGDEQVVLWNPGDARVDLTGWTLVMQDSKLVTHALAGSIGPFERFVLVDPDEQMNNDVRLELLRPDGTRADQVHLGTDVVDGDAGSILDEAVHLVGPWRGHKGPSTGAYPLDPYWVQSSTLVMAGLGPDAHAVRSASWFEAQWIGSDAALALDLNIAPNADTTGLALVLENGTTYGLSLHADGTWRTPLVGAPEAVTTFRIVGPDGATDRYPGRELLGLFPDLTPPQIGTDDVIANATGVLHRFPSIHTDGAPLEALLVELVEANGTTPLPACRPLGAPAAQCRVANATARLRIHALDAAGNRATRDTNVTFDTTPPTPPAEIGFATADRPTLMWEAPDEPLAALSVEAAEDVTGVWRVATWALDAQARGFVEDTWVPGSPRAYRLALVDHAGNTAASPWVALPPERVPVRTSATGLVEATRALIADGAVVVTLGFDRPMHAPPRLVVGASGDRPFQVTAEGKLDPAARAATYALETSAVLPRSGTATWRVEGGAGTDGAPLGAFAVVASWDLEPPRLDLEGVSVGWVQAARHVVALNAHDAAGAKARVDVDAKPDIAKVSGRVEARRVSFRGDGIHEIRGRVSDAAGNQAPFTVRVAMDATVPDVQATVPATWGASTPIHLQVADATSGVNRTSLHVWVRNATATAVLADPLWEDGSAVFAGPTDAWRGPLVVHVAVADEAGNLAEGSFGALAQARATPASEAKPAVAHGPAERPPAGAAPAPKGPGWARATSGSDGSDAAARAERLRDQYRTEPMQMTNATGSADEAPGAFAYGVLGVGGVMGAGLVARLARRKRPQRAPPEVSSAGRKV